MKTAINGTLWSTHAKHIGGTTDWKILVREAAEAGYEGVEIGGPKQLGEPAECRAFIESHGLEIAAFSAGITYNPWKPNTLEYRESIRYADRLGVRTLMVCGGFIPSPRRNTYAFDYDMFAGNLGEMMRFAAKYGIVVAFHPHRGSVVETAAEMREMLKRLPDLKICVDIAHLEAAGDDALAFIRTFRRQIVYTHIKDYSWKKDSFMELGRGDSPRLDVAACIDELKKGKYDGWLTVELDKKAWPAQPGPAIQTARHCRRYLAKCGF